MVVFGSKLIYTRLPVTYTYFGLLILAVFQVWRNDGGAKTPIPKEDIGKFYSGDCYIVLYTYHSHDKKEDYYLCSWIGKDSTEVINILSVVVNVEYAYAQCIIDTENTRI